MVDSEESSGVSVRRLFKDFGDFDDPVLASTASLG